MLTEQDAFKIAQTWIEDWNRHDLDAIMSHYAEDIVFNSPIIIKLLGNPEGKIQGKSALKDYFAKGLAAYPNLKFGPIKILIGVNSLVIYYHSIKDLFAAECMVINEQGLVTETKAHYSASPSDSHE
jgi:hypothetical protein